MIDARCSRKSFLAFGLSSLASDLVGCSEDPGTTTRAPTASTDGGSGATAGGGSGGSSATAGGGSGGSTATAGSGSGGSSATAGSGSGGSSATAGGGSTAIAGSGGGGSGVCNGDIVAKCSPAAADSHTHVLIVNAAAIAAGAETMIETQPDATGHSHSIPLTTADFLILKDGGIVIVDKCGAGPHQFVIKCGAIPEPDMPNCQQ